MFQAIGNFVDQLIGIAFPRAALLRMHSRKVMRGYAGAKASRLNGQMMPRNRSADQELAGADGADAMRAWARALVRDNAYAWGVIDTIVSSVIGTGIKALSVVETPEGDDVEDINELRDSVFAQWCNVCDYNGELNFDEIEALALREMAEAGECFIRFHWLPNKTTDGITRPVPLAIELIEADQLASDQDLVLSKRIQGTGKQNTVCRGIEFDDAGRKIAYWVYPQHPGVFNFGRVLPERIPAVNMLHLYLKNRKSQTRGVTWFAPVVAWIRDLGTYVDNELQASTVASCFGIAIKTESPIDSLLPSSGADTTDSRGNTFEFLEPGLVARLKPGESVESINPGRPNSASEPWINLLLRGIAVGTGLSYEIVARDYSKTSYSSSRTSQLEDRRRFRRLQKYLVENLCQPVWENFCKAAAVSGLEGFPTASELLENPQLAAPVEWQPPQWEWVDPQSEQTASADALQRFMTTYQVVLGSIGLSWRAVMYQRAKENRLMSKLGLMSPEQQQALIAGHAPSTAADLNSSGQGSSAAVGTGEWQGLSRLQWQRNRKALEDVLNGLTDGSLSPALAKTQLAMLGLGSTSIDAILADASDGTIDQPLPADTAGAAT